MVMRGINLGVLAAVFCVSALAACGGDDGGDSAPRGGSGGGAGSAGNDVPACGGFKACGGDPSGTWSVQDVCVENAAEVYAKELGGECASSFRSADVTGSGTYELGADMQASSVLTLGATVVLAFNDACVKSLGVTGSAASECKNLENDLKDNADFSGATCNVAGAMCNCTVTATPKMVMGEGAYAVESGNTIVIKGASQAFCASGNTLTVQVVVEGAKATFTFTK
jgi:hypothetical protein